MKKTDYVFYELVVEKNKRSGDNSTRVPVTLRGVVKETPFKVGNIFQQHLDAIDCVAIVSENYYPIHI